MYNIIGYIIMNYDKVLTEEIKDMIKKDYIENLFSIRDIAKNTT